MSRWIDSEDKRVNRTRSQGQDDRQARPPEQERQEGQPATSTERQPGQEESSQSESKSQSQSGFSRELSPRSKK